MHTNKVNITDVYKRQYINCQQLIKHDDTVTEVLRFETEQCEDTNAIEGVGSLNTITSPNFVIFHDKLALTHVLNKQLQHEEGTLGGASQIIKSTINQLKD